LIAGSVAKRYARALADTAEAPRALEAAREDLGAFAELLRAQPELRRFLANPSIPRQDAAEVVAEVAQRLGLRPLAGSFLRILAESGRLLSLEGILRAFEALVDERLGRVKAAVTTATPLPAAEAEALRHALGKLTGKDVYLEVRQEPAILGGVIAQIGSQVYDGSLRSRLGKLAEELVRA
jgi:F-type H+-transporting ATPase subunit delta